jgi:hypothetical protein
MRPELASVVGFAPTLAALIGLSLVDLFDVLFIIVGLGHMDYPLLVSALFARKSCNHRLKSFLSNRLGAKCIHGLSNLRHALQKSV